MTKEEAMFSTNTLRRLPVALALAGAVCAFTVPQALAGGTSKDSPPEPPYTRLSPVERIILQEKAHERDPVYSRGLVPAAPSAPDVVERYVAAHPYGRGLTLNPETPVNRPPDIQDTADTVNAVSSSTTLVARPPDVIDTAQALQSSSTGQSQGGFSWNDWGIGIGTGLGLALILGGGLLMGRQLRHHGVRTA
jgi:hypothetical protein